jgi:hypothetical protein
MTKAESIFPRRNLCTMSSEKNFVGIRRGYPKSRLGTARCCASIVRNTVSMCIWCERRNPRDRGGRYLTPNSGSQAFRSFQIRTTKTKPQTG